MAKKNSVKISLMQPGKIIQTKTINDRKFILRYPDQNDVETLRVYINELSAERTFIRYQGTQVSLETEQEYLTESLTKIRQNRKLSILALHNDLVVGHIEVTMLEQTEKHRGRLGASVKKGYRNQGLGDFMLKLLIKQAKQNLLGLEILELTVYANNDRAIHLYKKHGFQQFGRLPRGIKREDGYMDQIGMYKYV